MLFYFLRNGVIEKEKGIVMKMWMEDIMNSVEHDPREKTESRHKDIVILF